jgi:hypothetical protein
MTELLDHVYSSKIFIKIDLKNGYCLIYIKVGDNCKMAVQWTHGLYDCLVMHVRLLNALSSFHGKINYVLKNLLDKGLVVSIHEILIYTKNDEIHDESVKEVIHRLVRND